MSAATVAVEVQTACDAPDAPPQVEIEAWLTLALTEADRTGQREYEVCVRIVDEAESRELNGRYRGVDKSTNVLAFPAGADEAGGWPAGVPLPLGDLVVCAPVVCREAAEQGKAPQSHWAHLLVHGMLHLLGHDHETDAEAERMESLEVDILAAGGLENPYEDRHLS